MSKNFNLELFKKKEEKLIAAINKVRERLSYYKEWTENNFHAVYESLSEKERQVRREMIDRFRWNDYHDLDHRLCKRIMELHGEYYEWQFKTNGFVAYGLE